MITFEQFLQRFCKKAKIQPALSKEELTTFVRNNFFNLCKNGIINGTYLKRYRSQFERIGVLYNKNNYMASYLEDNKKLCIFVEDTAILAIEKNSIVYCKNGYISIADNVVARCENSSVICHDNSKINADWCDTINLFDNSEAIITHCSCVEAEDDAKIELTTCCVAFVLGNVTVDARDACYIQAQDNVNITASNHTCIIAKDNVKIEADETCLIKRV